jgi:hypothetical protein
MSRARDRARRRDRIKYALAGVALLFAGAVTFMIVQKEKEAALAVPDSITLCPSDGPKGHYVVLIDTTDPFTFTQREAFLSIVRDIVERRTPEGFLLSVFVVGEDYKEHAKPVVELCNPGTARDKSGWTSDVKGLRETYDNKFVGKMKSQAELLTRIQPAKASPIFEMIQLVGINGFERRAVKGEHRLIIISDMLQNTPGYSMFTSTPDFQKFADSAYGHKSQAHLPETSVELYYLMNSPNLQKRQNLSFWEAYFEKAQARIIAVKPIEG